MLVWLNSDALVSWFDLFGLGRLVAAEEFYHARMEAAIQGRALSYPNFLKDKFNYNFITTMLGCPLCLSVWLSSTFGIGIAIFFGNPISLLLIPTIVVAVLLIYGSITKVVRLS
jgi:hypothetical protein